MKKWNIRYVVIFAAAALILGYGLGRQVGAGSLIPGSQDDPLVTKSYVDSYLDSKYGELQNEIALLSSRVEQLERKIAGLSQGTGGTIKLTVGEKVAYIGNTPRQMEVPPAIYNGHTLLPLRFVGEALGAKFNYDPGTKTVTFSTAARSVTLKIGGTSAVVDGREVKLDVPARVVSGRTLVPLRFVGESLGAKVNWDGNTKTITVIP